MTHPTLGPLQPPRWSLGARREAVPPRSVESGRAAARYGLGKWVCVNGRGQGSPIIQSE